MGDKKWMDFLKYLVQTIKELTLQETVATTISEDLQEVVDGLEQQNEESENFRENWGTADPAPNRVRDAFNEARRLVLEYYERTRTSIITIEEAIENLDDSDEMPPPAIRDCPEFGEKTDRESYVDWRRRAKAFFKDEEITTSVKVAQYLGSRLKGTAGELMEDFDPIENTTPGTTPAVPETKNAYLLRVWAKMNSRYDNAGDKQVANGEYVRYWQKESLGFDEFLTKYQALAKRAGKTEADQVADLQSKAAQSLQAGLGTRIYADTELEDLIKDLRIVESRQIKKPGKRGQRKKKKDGR
ncbi:hypothetical protein BDD12DRAFT_884171 [Trichophaea hybrida]|nr:hypothetical protein BDD12DRAFT_884171 [Trichophaea hybrida]